MQDQTMRRAFLHALSLFTLAGCGAPVFLRDKDPIDRSTGYVLVVPDFTLGNGRFDSVDISIMRVETDTMTEQFYRNLKTRAPILLQLRPGFYYLGAIRALEGYYKFDLDARRTLFEVRAGQVNYPGDWSLRVVVHSFQTEGGAISGSAHMTYSVHQSAESNPDIERMFRSQFPSIAVQLPGPIYTRVVQASP